MIGYGITLVGVAILLVIHHFRISALEHKFEEYESDDE